MSSKEYRRIRIRYYIDPNPLQKVAWGIPESHAEAEEAPGVGHEADDRDLLVPQDPGYHGLLQISLKWIRIHVTQNL